MTAEIIRLTAKDVADALNALDTINERINYIKKQLIDVFRSIADSKIRKLNAGTNVHASTMGYWLTILDSIYELLIREV